MSNVIRKKSFIYAPNVKLLTIWFNTQVSNATTHKSKNSGFRLKVYRNILRTLKRLTSDIDNTTHALKLFREDGMKFTGEEKYYDKHGSWKSSVLQQIDYILTNHSLPEQEVDPKQKTIQELIRVPEIGISAAKKFYDMGILTIQDLAKESSKDSTLLNRKQLLGLKYYKDLEQRIPRSEMDKWNTLAHNYAKELGIRLEIVGSYRRGVAHSGDIDIMITHHSETAMTQLIDHFSKDGIIMDTFVHGKKKFGGVAKIDKVCRKLDIAFYPPEQYPFALLHWTGSGDFNQIIRAFVKKKGLSLCEYGLSHIDGKVPVSIPDEIECSVFEEKDIFRYLGIDYVQPCDRTNAVSFV